MRSLVGTSTNGNNTAAKPIIQNKLVLRISGDSTAIGVTKLVTPKTEPILKILDPIKFPKEIAFSRFMAAITDAANSGMLVPTAITVTDITYSEIPKELAN